MPAYPVLCKFRCFWHSRNGYFHGVGHFLCVWGKGRRRRPLHRFKVNSKIHIAEIHCAEINILTCGVILRDKAKTVNRNWIIVDIRCQRRNIGNSEFFVHSAAIQLIADFYTVIALGAARYKQIKLARHIRIKACIEIRVGLQIHRISGSHIAQILKITLEVELYTALWVCLTGYSQHIRIAHIPVPAPPRGGGVV